MKNIIYLEPNDEITSVIERLRLNDDLALILVIPRGCSLAQSLVNLKILKRSAEEMGKDIGLVANDPIARNLASQIGLEIFSKVTEAERFKPCSPKAKEAVLLKAEDIDPNSPFHVHSYSRYDGPNGAEIEAEPVQEEKDEEKTTEPKKEAEPSRATEEIEPEPILTHKPVTSQEKKDDSDIPVEAETAKKVEPIDQKNNSVLRSTEKTGRPKSPLFFLVLILVAIVLSGFVFLPFTSVSLAVKTDPFEKDLNVAINTGAKAIDAENTKIPGTLLSQEKEVAKNFRSTGVRNIGEKAKGKIKIQNSFDSKSHTFPKGTRFLSGGKVFTADEEFSVGAASTALVGGKVSVSPGEGSVSVMAAQPGDAYNLAPANYVIAEAPSQIVGKGEAMTGGISKELKVVTDEDLALAKREVSNIIALEAERTIKDQAEKQNLRLLDGSISRETSSVSQSHEAESEAEEFETTVTMKVFSIGFKESDLHTLLEEAHSKNVERGKMLVNPSKADISYEMSEGEISQTGFSVNTNFKGRTSKRIDAAELKRSIKNKDVLEAKRSLEEIDAIEKVEISYWPKFLNRTPLLVSRIKVNFDYSK